MIKFFFCLLMTFSSSVWANSKVGNGGGGVLSDGNYLTLPESGIQIEGHMMLDVPGVSQVSQGLRALHVSSLILKDYLPKLYSSAQRQYYSISHLDPEAMNELKKIYGDLLKLPPEKVVIFAVTDTEAAKTFLLPDFFKLNETQQASVIFHEWLWTIQPQATYADVIYGEDLFYRFRQDSGQYFPLAVYLAQMLQRPEILLAPAFYFAGPNVTADQVISENLLMCLKPYVDVESSDNMVAEEQCLYDWSMELATLDSANDIQKAIARYVTMGGALSWHESPGGILSRPWRKDAVVYDDIEGKMSLLSNSARTEGELIFLKAKSN